MNRYRVTTISAVLLLGLLAPAPAFGQRTQLGRSAAHRPNAATLLHRSLSLLQRQTYGVHGVGVLQSRGCCPKRSASAGVGGDCVHPGSTTVSMRFAVRGTVIPTRAVVPIDSHYVLKFSAHGSHVWIRSPATHNRWKVDASRDWELGLYLCPPFLAGEITQHFPARLVNLGLSTVRGRAAWHLRDELPPVRSVFIRTDYYLDRASLTWLRYEYTSSSGVATVDGTDGQLVAIDYTPESPATRIDAPRAGSPAP